MNALDIARKFAALAHADGYTATYDGHAAYASMVASMGDEEYPFTFLATEHGQIVVRCGRLRGTLDRSTTDDDLRDLWSDAMDS